MRYNIYMDRVARKLLTVLLALLVVFLGVPLLTLIPFSTSQAPGFSTSAGVVDIPEGKELLVWITAYTSSPEETDSTPRVTASQTGVRDGVVAANFLPFGTLIQIPELFGEKLFVVEDRLHSRKRYVVDVWMEDKQVAKEFGSHLTEIVVVQKPGR
jgi:3D (Asp-Asp-Asp) domain-containing protein